MEHVNFHRFVETRHDDTPEADVWHTNDEVWRDIFQAFDLIERTPIHEERNRHDLR